MKSWLRAATPGGWPILRPTRRELLAAGGAFAALAAVAGTGCRPDERERVCVAKAASYEVDLEPIVREALAEIGWREARVRGRRFLLKPNLVETSLGAGHINTHPMVVRAAALALYSLGAREVVVGEGPATGETPSTSSRSRASPRSWCRRSCASSTSIASPASRSPTPAGSRGSSG
jgi:hypothetical protein